MQGDRKPRVAIVVDSAASLPPDISQYPGIYVVPLILNFQSKTYLDGRDISPSEFYRLLRDSSEVPTTSAPSPASFMDAFREAYGEGIREILCLTVGSTFSSSADSASAAAEEASKEMPDIEIRVLDSKSAAGGEGLITTEAWRTAQLGGDLDTVVKAAQRVISKVRLLAFVDTLYYLWRGGRVPRIAHAGTSLLSIKPIFEMAQGEVNTLARPRTKQRAIRRLLELTRERVQPNDIHATVMHADSSEAAEELRQQIASEFDCQELFISEFTPVMGAHIGPGLVGVAFWG